jgi:glycerol-3-phosphate dehydrogenase (NAD(P)+)
VNAPIAVLGAGSWGSALAVLLAGKDLPVRLWGRDAKHIASIKSTRANPDYLPGITIPGLVTPTVSLTEALCDTRVVLVVAPSRALRALADQLAASGDLAPGAVLVSCTKGLEHGTGLRMSEILAQKLPAHPVAVLSGPSHAEEVARNVPAAVVLGCADVEVAKNLQQTFNTRAFRTYTSDDVAGIELGGALKNIFAIAAGICDGLGLGDNTKAALVTRSLAELIRLGVRLGGQRETFQGLSGIGDLMVTCFSRHSRNRLVGERIGRGETLEAITASMKMVAEGVPTTRSAWECARKVGVVTPVIDQMHGILYGHQSPKDALSELMLRDPKPERED